MLTNTEDRRSTAFSTPKPVREAAACASERLVGCGLPLPTVTPHTLRRTYVSLALIAFLVALQDGVGRHSK